MTIEVLQTGMLMCQVHEIEIIRMKQGPDHIRMRTNKKNPCYPYVGEMVITTTVTRNAGPEWCRINFPRVETHLFDATMPVQSAPRAVIPISHEGGLHRV